MELRNIRLFRMTHIENVEHILTNGITHKNSINSNATYTPIGDHSLISTRDSFPMENGRTLGDYIPFYFSLRTPMLYVIQNGFNGVRSTSPESIVYCATNLDLIRRSEVDYIYTDGHATDRFSNFFAPDSVDNIADHLDFQAINALYWKVEGDLDFKRRKEAELLLVSDLPTEYIAGLIVYNSSAKNYLIENGVTLPIAIRPNFYF